MTTSKNSTDTTATTATGATSEAIRPFRVEIPQDALDDLKRRLDNTRYAAPTPSDDWSYGTPVSYLRGMVERWRDFDWRAVEERANAYPHFLTDIDGQTVHFIHVRSRHEEATPVVLAHSYPGSFLDFLDMIEPLTDPEAHGGRA